MFGHMIMSCIEGKFNMRFGQMAVYFKNVRREALAASQKW